MTAVEGAPAPSQAAAKLGASHVVAGALSRRADVVLASLNLMDAAENRILWGTQLEMHDNDMTALASALAHQIAQRLGATLAALYDVPESALRRSEIAESPVVSEALGTVQRHEFHAAVQAGTRLVETYPNEPNALAFRVQANLNAWHGLRTPASASLLDDALAALERADPKHPLIEISRVFAAAGGSAPSRGLP